ncbi:hypothetical protein [Streptomyces sp. NPDC017448]|uniref:hypothetical protein n=1 Tax=Streptomyces sp. NPDC017448 TaxID=3364996 RepID=UPI0037B733DC
MATNDYCFVVPGTVTVRVSATSEANARELLEMEAGDSLELDTVAPIQVGPLSIGTLDLVGPAAKVDSVGEELTNDSLPDADFSVSTIARVAVRSLPGTWDVCPGTLGVSASMSEGVIGAEYVLEVVDGRLSLFDFVTSCSLAVIDDSASLVEMAKEVADAILKHVTAG